jgi:hypothetical protein
MVEEKGPTKVRKQQNGVDSKKSKKKAFTQRKTRRAEKSFRLRNEVLIERKRGDET